MSLMLNKLRTVARHPSKPEGKGTTRKPEGASASLDKPIFTRFEGRWYPTGQRIPHTSVVVSRARPSRKTEGSGVTAMHDSFLSPRFTGNHTSHVLLMARVWLDNSMRIWRALARAYLHFCAHQLLIIHVPIIAFLQNELLIAVTPDPSVFLEGLARETNQCGMSTM